MDEELCVGLLRLETALAERDETAIDGGYESVLHEDFEEIGASGRHWTRAETLDALRAAWGRDVEIDDFRVVHVSDDVVLAMFETAGDRPARRSSLWLRDGSHWRLRFHQATPL
jgi:ribonuclease HI